MLDLAVRPLGHSEKNSLNSISYKKTGDNTSKKLVITLVKMMVDKE